MGASASLLYHCNSMSPGIAKLQGVLVAPHPFALLSLRLYGCMDRGAWRATAHGVARVRHDLATKHQPRASL